MNTRSSAFGLALAAAALLSACGSSSEPTPPPAGKATASASSAPATSAPPTVAPATAPPSAFQPQPPGTLAERDAKFQARPSASPPDSLPAAWRKAMTLPEARFGSISHECHTAWAKSTPFDALTVEVRFFGTDAANDTRALSVLRGFGLKAEADTLPPGQQTDGDRTWRIERHAQIAPQGEAREVRYAFEVVRDPVLPLVLPECKNPESLTAPRTTPAFLLPLVKASSTRRLVSVVDRRADTDDTLMFHILFHNGEANDDMVGRVREAVLAAGFRLVSGAESNRQLFADPGRRRLEIRPSNDDLRLGCKVVGPIMAIELMSPRGAPNK